MKLQRRADLGQFIAAPRPDLNVRQLVDYERATHPRQPELPHIPNPPGLASTKEARRIQ